MNDLTARWALDGGQTVLATASPSKADRTSVLLTHQRLGDSADVVPAKVALQARLVVAASIAAMQLG
ncbi:MULTISPECIES: hypothetical protein [unclassified Cryobacterium]|uniref:hypothetical protein n=1 Tax=unclassified Cryobacterium TaxID=2649013 RepID=UPI000CE3A02A|nr:MULTISPECIES: hypothetical protein [unclassified Cryobacterium]